MANWPGDKSTWADAFARDRLLCRFFRDKSNTNFVLKGGLGILARIPNARYTRDIDLATEMVHDDLLAELEKVIAYDLGDFFEFSIEESSLITPNLGQPQLGGRSLAVEYQFGKISGVLKLQIVDCSFLPARIERLQPTWRVIVPGLVNYDYLVYPIAYQVSDKVFGVTIKLGERESSRTKDLVDLVLIAGQQSVNRNELQLALEDNARAREVTKPKAFEPPQHWFTSEMRNKISRELDPYGHTFESALELVRQFLSLDKDLPPTSKWSPNELLWLDD